MAHNNYTNIKFTQSARKHRIGKVHALHVIENYEPVVSYLVKEQLKQYEWNGFDSRDRELEIVARQLGETLLVIHVMPTIFRRK